MSSFHHKIVFLLLFSLTLILGCSSEKLTQLNTDQNKTIRACGYKASQINKGYSWYKFTDSTNRALNINEIRFGVVGKDTTNNIIATDSCLAFKKLKNIDYYVYTYNREDKSGNILESNNIDLSISLNELNLPKMNENPIHFRSCGKADMNSKERLIYAISIGFHDDYKEDKNTDNISISRYIDSKTTDDTVLNKYGCFYYLEKEKNQIIEIRKKGSEEIIYRRPINIWTQKHQELSSSKISICGSGIYGLKGKCVSHFQYYCQQKENIEPKYKNFVEFLNVEKKENCAEIEQYIKKTNEIIESGKNNQEISLEPIFYLNHFTYIELKGRQIEDLTSIKNFKSLENLTLENNRIKTLSGLENLNKLNRLDLEQNKLKNLDNFTKSFLNLEMLDLSNNPLVDLNSLIYFTNLKSLSLNFTKIENLEPIGKIASLEELSMEYANARDISFISKLINLTTINFRFNNIENIDPLEDLITNKPSKSFDKIILSSNKKIGKNGINLSGLESIGFLNLFSCDINNISSLEKVIIYEKLQLRNNNIENLQPLKNSDIYDIDVTGNPITKGQETCPEDGTNDSLKKFCIKYNKKFN